MRKLIAVVLCTVFLGGCGKTDDYFAYKTAGGTDVTITAYTNSIFTVKGNQTITFFPGADNEREIPFSLLSGKDLYKENKNKHFVPCTKNDALVCIDENSDSTYKLTYVIPVVKKENEWLSVEIDASEEELKTLGIDLSGKSSVNLLNANLIITRK